MSERPSYAQVFLTSARNRLIRDMTFRTNFVLQCVSSASWAVMNVEVYQHGWGMSYGAYLRFSCPS